MNNTAATNNNNNKMYSERMNVIQKRDQYYLQMTIDLQLIAGVCDRYMLPWFTFCVRQTL